MAERTLGQALRAARAATDLTQRDVAASLHVHHTYVAHMERGTMGYPPSAEFLEGYAVATGADPDELCFLAGKVPSDIVAALTIDLDFLRQVRDLLKERANVRPLRRCAACGHQNDGYGEPDNCFNCASPLGDA